MKNMLAKFHVGQLVYNKHYRYRGIVVDVDSSFQRNEEWYEKLARNTRPAKDQPWYHVLIDDDGGETYVAERHLEADSTETPIEHALVEKFFESSQEGSYQRKGWLN